MTALRSLIAGLVGALALVAGAQAADMPGTWTPPVAVPRFADLMSGLYVRFDGGYRWNKVGSFESFDPVTSFSIKNSPDLTFGAGVKYGWMRFDLTVDRGFRTSYTGTTAAAVPQPQYTGKIASWTALANAYIDFGSWWGFTPYVGGGVGATLLQSESYNNTALLPIANGSPQTEQTNFSWAAMAGVAFQISPQWMVDVGFRHLDLGDVSNRRLGGAVGGFDSTVKGISANEVRAGVRFLFD